MNRLFTKFINNVKPVIKQTMYYSKYAFAEEYTVHEFCKLNIRSPYNVKIRPLDVHQYSNSDKLFVKFQSEVPAYDLEYQVLQDRDSIFITSNYEKPSDVNCYIEAPIKSDINIMATRRGSIDIKNFRGDHIHLSTESGDIVSKSCQNSTIKFTTKTGNIVSNGTLHAADITLETQESGCIIAKHLQALKSSLKTQDGDVSVDSCYCDVSKFETETGKLTLNNIHKYCIVNITDCGILQMTGFDGTLNATINSGEADIQLTKLHDISKIEIVEKSPILVRIAETVTDNTQIKALCKTLTVPQSIRMIQEKKGDSLYLSPLNNKFLSQLFIQCPTSALVLDEASWADMIGLKRRNF